MSKEFLRDFCQIADKHSSRLTTAVTKTKPLLPLDVEKFKALQDEEIAYLDMLTTRFGKLQDVIGAKIFPLILEILQEDAPAFIDKLHKLEKLGYLENTNWWLSIREARNQIAHDYPSNDDILCEHFNNFALKAGELISYWALLKKKTLKLL